MKSERTFPIVLLTMGALISGAVALGLDLFAKMGESASWVIASAYDLVAGPDLLYVFSIVGGVVCIILLVSFIADALTEREGDSVVC